MAYINKEEFIAFIDKKMGKSGLGYLIGNQLKDYINTQPTADVEEVKHGEWIKKVVEKHGIHRPTFICSKCGKRRFVLADYNYCPHCGAKMDSQL